MPFSHLVELCLNVSDAAEDGKNGKELDSEVRKCILMRRGEKVILEYWVKCARIVESLILESSISSSDLEDCSKLSTLDSLTMIHRQALKHYLQKVWLPLLQQRELESASDTCSDSENF